MGVYIPGIQMPKSCGMCPCILYGMGDIFCCITKERVLDVRKQLDNCPLIEVAEPHGRLVDENVAKVTSEYGFVAPTVIEAEGMK